MAERFGVEGRGSFYDETGAIRDVLQNHLLQVTAILAMEPPIGKDPEAIRDENTRVLRATAPLDPARVVCGRFREYRVPFLIRTSKRLPVTAAEVLVQLTSKRAGTGGGDAIARPLARSTREIALAIR